MQSFAITIRPLRCSRRAHDSSHTLQLLQSSKTQSIGHGTISHLEKHDERARHFLELIRRFVILDVEERESLTNGS